MPGPTKLERARMNKHLRAHGLGDLNDPTIVHQLAFLVRDHDHFRNVLMKVTPDKRALAYQALAPKVRFKAKALELYEMEGKQLAERERLPIYNPETLAVTEFQQAPISEEMKEGISGKTAAERRQAELNERAETAISEDIGKSVARGRLSIECAHCRFGATVYASDRADAYATLVATGWTVQGDKAWCPDCEPTVDAD